VLCSRTGDQIDNGSAGEQWSATPILGDKAKEAVLNLVPLARSRWKVADMHRQLDFISKLLQGDFPQPGATAIASATIRRNEQFLGVGVALLP
jgi:hypothetical protein